MKSYGDNNYLLLCIYTLYSVHTAQRTCILTHFYKKSFDAHMANVHNFNDHATKGTDRPKKKKPSRRCTISFRSLCVGSQTKNFNMQNFLRQITDSTCMYNCNAYHKSHIYRQMQSISVHTQKDHQLHEHLQSA